MSLRPAPGGQGDGGQGREERTFHLAPIHSIKIGSLKVGGDGNEVRTEMDSHADTCVVGEETALIIQDFDRLVRVFGYSKDVGQPDRCKTVSGVVAYDHPETGETFMLVIHQAILIPNMTANLLSSMQLRDNDLKVNDEPKYLVQNPTEQHHAIDIAGTEDEEAWRIPLLLNGVISYFPTRRPTRKEWLESEFSKRICLTAESPEWDPQDSRFGEQESAMLDSRGRLREKPEEWNSKRIVAALHSIPQGYMDGSEFGQALQGTVRLKSVTARDKRLAAVRTSEKGRPVSARRLAKLWGIGLKAAERTLESTTQRVIRTVSGPLSQRFRTNDRQLRYRRIAHEMFTDTLKSRVISWKRKKIRPSVRHPFWLGTSFPNASEVRSP